MEVRASLFDGLLPGVFSGGRRALDRTPARDQVVDQDDHGDNYQDVNQVATDASGAKSTAQAAQTVNDTLESQRSALSGVSMDEEAVNMMRQQRAFQAASRVVSAVDESRRG